MAITHPANALTDLQKRKLFDEASKLTNYLSPNQINQAHNSPQFSDDAFIFSLIKQARKERNSFFGKIKRWFNKNSDFFKIIGIVYLTTLAMIIVGAGILIAVSATPLAILTALFSTPMAILSTVALVVGGSLASTLCGIAMGAIEIGLILATNWVIAKISSLFTKQSPEFIQKQKETHELKYKYEETKIPSFDKELQPLHAEVIRLVTPKSSYLSEPDRAALISYIGNSTYTKHSFFQFNPPLNNNQEKALINIIPWTNINSLSFKHQISISNPGILSLAKHPQIQKIAFKFNTAFDNASIQELTKLTHLKEFSHNNLTPDKETYRALLLTNTTFEKVSVNLHYTQDADKASFQHICDLVKENRNLKSVTFSNVNINALTLIVRSANPYTVIHEAFSPIFSSNVYLQEIKFKHTINGFIQDNTLDSYLDRNRKLAAVRERAQKLLNDIKQNRVYLNSEQLSCTVNSVAEELTRTTTELLRNVISKEVEDYKAEMEELANNLHETTGAWIQEKTDRKIGQTPAEKLPQLNLEFAAKHFFAVTAQSRQQFSRARISGFEHAFLGRLQYCNDTNKLTAFFDAFAKACLDKTNQLFLLDSDIQEVIDNFLIGTTINPNIPCFIPTDEERLAFLQYGFMKHAYDSLLSEDPSLALPIQAKRDRFKNLFATLDINLEKPKENPCQTIKKIWNTLLEAQGAITNQSKKILMDAICGYGEKVEKDARPVLRR